MLKSFASYIKAFLPICAPFMWPHLWFHMPTFTYQAMIWLSYRNWPKAAFALEALCFDLLMYLIADTFVTFWENAYLKRFMALFGDFRVEAFPLKDLLEQHRHKLYQFFFPPERFAHLTSLDPPMEERFRAFRLMPPKGVPRLDHLTTFQDLNGSCVIFLNDRRELLTRVQRFDLLHELGHGTNGNALATAAKTGGLRFLAFCFWVLFSGGGPFTHSLALIGVLIVGAVIRFRWAHSPLYLTDVILQQEMWADRFAVEAIEADFLPIVLYARLAHPIQDRRMTKENSTRNEYLVKILRQRLAGQSVDHPPNLTKKLSSYLSLANLTALALLAWMGQSVTNRMLVISAALILGFTFVYLFVLGPASFVGRRHLIEQLEEREVAA